MIPFTVEDHYCRFFLVTPGGLKEKLIKSALSQVTSKLPLDRFLRVHRSHVVNLAHAIHLKKKGRSHALILKTAGYTLPVSRHRLSQLPPELK